VEFRIRPKKNPPQPVTKAMPNFYDFITTILRIRLIIRDPRINTHVTHDFVSELKNIAYTDKTIVNPRQMKLITNKVNLMKYLPNIDI